MRKILLTGKNGQVGWELQRTLATLGDVIAVGHHEMDLADPDSIRRVIGRVGPDLIVNAAAYTAVDKAESEPDLAMAINGIAPGIMAEEAKRLNATIIHYSTDYVFDGAGKHPYVEENAPNPLNIYGKTKLAGERAIQAAGVSHLILRTSWVYGTRGRNFLLTILRLARERGELKIVDDQFGNPTWSRVLAEVTAQMLAQYFSPRENNRNSVPTPGLYHVSSGGMTTWHGFSEAILKAQVHRHFPVQLKPIKSSEYESPAKRPQNSCLSNEKFSSTFNLALPSWEKSLSMCMDEINEVVAKRTGLSALNSR